MENHKGTLLEVREALFQSVILAKLTKVEEAEEIRGALTRLDALIEAVPPAMFESDLYDTAKLIHDATTERDYA